MRAEREPVARRLGRNLFLARRSAALSQEELAVLCSLHRTEIGLIESGKRIPRVDTFIKLVTVLEVQADHLLRGIDWTMRMPAGPGAFHVSDYVG
jgi:transcriptional regulator with XRE-family HTH domain